MTATSEGPPLIASCRVYKTSPVPSIRVGPQIGQVTIISAAWKPHTGPPVEAELYSGAPKSKLLQGCLFEAKFAEAESFEIASSTLPRSTLSLARLPHLKMVPSPPPRLPPSKLPLLEVPSSRLPPSRLLASRLLSWRLHPSKVACFEAAFFEAVSLEAASFETASFETARFEAAFSEAAFLKAAFFEAACSEVTFFERLPASKLSASRPSSRLLPSEVSASRLFSSRPLASMLSRSSLHPGEQARRGCVFEAASSRQAPRDHLLGHFGEFAICFRDQVRGRLRDQESMCSGESLPPPHSSSNFTLCRCETRKVLKALVAFAWRFVYLGEPQRLFEQRGGTIGGFFDTLVQALPPLSGASNTSSPRARGHASELPFRRSQVLGSGLSQCSIREASPALLKSALSAVSLGLITRCMSCSVN